MKIKQNLREKIQDGAFLEIVNGFTVWNVRKYSLFTFS